jgi:predicted cupin superfamily sugar epimerase
MQAHPEGGYYKEIWRAAGEIPADALPEGYAGPRNYGTSILYMLIGKDISRMHRLISDEIWYYHTGGPVAIHILAPDGEYRCVTLGLDPDKGEAFQAVIPAGSWFGAEVAERNSYSLVGCVVAPGFDFKDWELANVDELCRQYPMHREWLIRLS